MSDQQPILEFCSVSKFYGDFRANQNVSFAVQRGTIHALVGENGAGKSTLMKILFGIEKLSTGYINLNGKKLLMDSPVQAKSLGLGMVHQHFMLAGSMTALDHILLEEKTSLPWWKSATQILPRQKKLHELKDLSKKYKMDVPWSEKVENLPVGVQQRIEILKILHNESEILILDEPTAVLTPHEIDTFLAQLQFLRKAGKTIILITHKLKEVLHVADQITILRQGKVIHTGEIAGESVESLSEKMIGRNLPQTTKPAVEKIGSSVLTVKDLSYKFANRMILNSMNFEIHAGEVVGIAGVEGNGQSELLDCLVRPKTLAGKLTGHIDGNEMKHRTFAYFPEDRLHQGILVNQNGPANFLLGQSSSPQFQKWGWINQKSLAAQTAKMMEAFDVRPRDLSLPLGQFSGGNQQKFVVGRELGKNSKLLIAAQPTRGVDIGASHQIHSEILRAQENGTAVLLVSSDLDELLKLSDRLLVLYRGQFVKEFARPEFDEKKIGYLMAGGTA